MNNKNVHFCHTRVYILAIYKCTFFYLLIISVLCLWFEARMALLLLHAGKAWSPSRQGVASME